MHCNDQTWFQWPLLLAKKITFVLSIAVLRPLCWLYYILCKCSLNFCFRVTVTAVLRRVWQFLEDWDLGITHYYPLLPWKGNPAFSFGLFIHWKTDVKWSLGCGLVSRRNVHPGQSTKKQVTYNTICSLSSMTSFLSGILGHKKLANNNQKVSTHDQIRNVHSIPNKHAQIEAGSPSSPPLP